MSTPGQLRLEAWRSILERAWAADTSASPADWSTARPSVGQCAVSALLIQDYEGGTLIRVNTNRGSHYFNDVPGVGHVDLTRDQFSPDESFSAAAERTREYVLSFAETRRRYRILSDRVRRLLGGGEAA